MRRFAFLLVLAAVASLGHAADLSGIYQSPQCSPSQFGYSQLVARFTSSTFSFEKITFSDAACTVQLFAQHTFGVYSMQSTIARSLFIGTGSTLSLTQDVYYLGRARTNYVPASDVGASFLNGIVAASNAASTCVSRARIGTFSVGDVKDMSFVDCVALDVLPISKCPTWRTLVTSDATSLYLALSTISAMCDVNYPAAATFNDGNCAGSDSGCITHSLVLTPPPDYIGEWALACRTFNLTVNSQSLQWSEMGGITMGRGEWAMNLHKFSGAGCVSGSEVAWVVETGNLQISRQLPLPFNGYLGEFALLSRMILPVNAAGVNLLNTIANGDTDCTHELGNLTAGAFVPATYATCTPLRLYSQAVCPIHYWTVRVTGNQLFLPDPEVASPCAYPSAPLAEITLTRTTAAGLSAAAAPSFGTSIPAFYFSGEQQAQTSVDNFFTGLQEARSSSNYSFISTLITSDFALTYPGDIAYISLAGTYTNLPNQPQYNALQRFLAAWNQQFSQSYMGDYVVVGGGDEYSAVVQFPESLTQNATMKSVQSQATTWQFQFRNGLISAITIQLDTLSLAAASCPSGLMCGQSAPVTMVTTVTSNNQSSITNNVYAPAYSAPPVNPADEVTTSVFDDSVNIYLGLAAIIFVLSVFVFITVFVAIRNTSGLGRLLDRERYSFRSQRHDDDEISSIPSGMRNIESPVV